MKYLFKSTATLSALYLAVEGLTYVPFLLNVPSDLGLGVGMFSMFLLLVLVGTLLFGIWGNEIQQFLGDTPDGRGKDSK